MDETLIDGRSPPKKGDVVVVRVLQDESGGLVVDRPYKDRPLEIAFSSDLTFPEEAGTYEVQAQIRSVAFADQKGPDYFGLKDATIEKISEEIEPFSVEVGGPGPDSGAESVDVDVDPDIIPSTSTESQTASRGSVSIEGHGKNFNHLLLD